MRLGTTSYIIPADILPNVEYLAPLVDDIQLLLFETDDYGSNLPDAGLCRQLAALAARHNLTYTVHLPLDLRLAAAAAAEEHVSMLKARRVIAATRALEPFAYTVHLDGRELAASALPCAGQVQRWQSNASRALERLCGDLPMPEMLCVENLESYEPELLAPVLRAVPVSRTVDIGHLWLQDADPVSHLSRWRERTRVIHLHGIAERDHASLEHVPPARLDPVVAMLQNDFSGIVTLEVFNADDFHSSVRCFNEASQRQQRSFNS